MRGVVTSGLVNAMAGTLGRQALGAVLTLLTLMLIARVFGAAGNGTYALAVLLPTMLVTLLNLGIGPANVYFLGSRRASLRVVMRTNVVAFAALGFVGVVAGATMIWFFSEELFAGVPSTLLWLALLAFPLGLVAEFLFSVMQALQAFRSFNLLQLVAPAVLLALVGALAWIEGSSLVLLVTSFVTSQALVAVLATVQVRRLVRERDDRSADGLRVGAYLRQVVSYGWKAHGSNILAFVNYRADIFLTNLFLAPASVGVYVVAVGIAERLWLPSRAVGTVLLPRLASMFDDERGRRELTPLMARTMLWGTGLLAALVAVAASLVLGFLFGSEFSAGASALRILLPGVVFGAASRILANDIAARGRPGINLIGSVAVVTLNIALNLVLIPRMGIDGAALATTIAYSVNLAIRVASYSILTRVPWFEALTPRISDAVILWRAVR